MKLALIQMVSGTQWQANLNQAHQFLIKAAQLGAEMAVLPEYFCLMGQRDQDKLDIQEPFGNGPIQQALADWAKAMELWLVAGTMPITPGAGQNADSGQRVNNTTLVFNPQGQCVARYDKIHLFKFTNNTESYDESRVLIAGHQPAWFELTTRAGKPLKVGLSVCYDLRFPELYRALSAAGCGLMLVPSAFTQTTGQAHWEVLLRARAIENLAYVAGVAQGGHHDNGRQTWGHTMLVDPWGQVVADRASGPGLVLADLDFDWLETSRQRLPALQHRVL